MLPLHPRFPLLVALSFLVCLLTCAGGPAFAGPASLAPAAGQTAVRLPRLHLHGSALAGAPRDFGVDEIDRLALLVTWKILDPYKRAENRYTGILLKDLVDTLAPGATHVRMRAVNDYVAVFERADWETLPILLATRDGDARMPVAAKGPARIVFMQTHENEMAMQVHAPKWIWQVIDVEFQQR
jgi:hypothetical protein